MTKNDYYLIETDTASGILLFTDILKHNIIGIKKNKSTIIPWLIKNKITEILESDDNYNAKNIVEKHQYKKELQEKLTQKFENNKFQSLKLEFEAYSNNNLTKTIIYVSKVNLIND